MPKHALCYTISDWDDVGAQENKDCRIDYFFWNENSYSKYNKQKPCLACLWSQEADLELSEGLRDGHSDVYLLGTGVWFLGNANIYAFSHYIRKHILFIWLLISTVIKCYQIFFWRYLPLKYFLRIMINCGLLLRFCHFLELQ